MFDVQRNCNVCPLLQVVRTLSRMVANLLVDFAAGSIPLVGDRFDIRWKANSRNLKLLRDYLHSR